MSFFFDAGAGVLVFLSALDTGAKSASVLGPKRSNTYKTYTVLNLQNKYYKKSVNYKNQHRPERRLHFSQLFHRPTVNQFAQPA